MINEHEGRSGHCKHHKDIKLFSGLLTRREGIMRILASVVLWQARQVCTLAMQTQGSAELSSSLVVKVPQQPCWKLYAAAIQFQAVFVDFTHQVQMCCQAQKSEICFQGEVLLFPVSSLSNVRIHQIKKKNQKEECYSQENPSPIPIIVDQEKNHRLGGLISHIWFSVF